MSIRITADVDKLALDWLNKQENRSKSVLNLITAFAHLEKYGRPELVQLLFNSLLSDSESNENKAVFFHKENISSDRSDKSVGDELYDEVFGVAMKDKTIQKDRKGNDLFNAIKSIIK